MSASNKLWRGYQRASGGQYELQRGQEQASTSSRTSFNELNKGSVASSPGASIAGEADGDGESKRESGKRCVVWECVVWRELMTVLQMNVWPLNKHLDEGGCLLNAARPR